MSNPSFTFTEPWMEEVGLIPPLPAGEDADPDDIDPVAAWYEWVEYVQHCHSLSDAEASITSRVGSEKPA